MPASASAQPAIYDLDLGFDKPRGETRVVAAMSGGVDSSVVAALLNEAGYDVVGITLQLYDHGAAVAAGTSAGAPVKTRTCCAGQDIYDARRVADRLGIPHYVLDYESRFRDDVIDDFVESYVRGETPIPCVRCNQTVKFRDLLAKAKELGADALATGHYVRRDLSDDGRIELRAGLSADRDQSYFLFATTPEQLSMLRFPLGGLSKDEVREHARRFGLANADKPDSQDICFVPNGDYASLVTRLRPEAARPGDIVDLSGTVIGQHQGIINYTIGQRRGLGLGGRKGGDTDPLYVVRLNPDTAQVVVGVRDSLEITRVEIAEVNWLGDNGDIGAVLPDGDMGPIGPIEVTARLRSTMVPSPAHLTLHGDGTASLDMLSPQIGIAPGQAAVFYDPAGDGTRVLGGGWIRQAERLDAPARRPVNGDRAADPAAP